MLERLLQTLQAGGTHTLAGLARELETSETLVEMMVEELARMGYLAAAQESCTEHCAGCHTVAPCVVGGATRVWTLTDRG
jgi:Mn-dependent DtxR family transcriptional regulator